MLIQARGREKQLRTELERVGGSGKRVAQHATKLEVKYEQLREKYDADLASLIEVRLQAAEAHARLREYEEALGISLSAGAQARAPSSDAEDLR